jgi:hypothetical protein
MRSAPQAREPIVADRGGEFLNALADELALWHKFLAAAQYNPEGQIDFPYSELALIVKRKMCAV